MEKAVIIIDERENFTYFLGVSLKTGKEIFCEEFSSEYFYSNEDGIKAGLEEQYGIDIVNEIII